LVPRNGYCGAPSDNEALKPFTCAVGNCCGKGLATGAGEETAIYSCQKIGTASYQPLKMEGYDQFDSDEDWPFRCDPDQISAGYRIMYGMIASMMAVLVYLI